MTYTDEQGTWYWPEDIAALVPVYDNEGRQTGTMKPETISWMLSNTRRRIERGTSRPYDLPLQDRRRKRPVERADGGNLVVWSPQWREETVTAWLAARQDKAAHAEAWHRPRADGSGQFLPLREGREGADAEAVA
jgi:hypothetical protein